MFGLFVGLGIGHPLDDDPEQLDDRISDRILADRDNPFTGIVSIDELFESGLSVNQVGVTGIFDALVANNFCRTQKLVIEQQFFGDLLGEVDIVRNRCVARRNLAEKATVKIDESFQDDVVFAPELYRVP